MPDAKTCGTCATCRFWSNRNSGFEYGECRRRAPVARAEGAQSEEFFAYWPVTHALKWCGEGGW